MVAGVSVWLKGWLCGSRKGVWWQGWAYGGNRWNTPILSHQPQHLPTQLKYRLQKKQPSFYLLPSTKHTNNPTKVPLARLCSTSRRKTRANWASRRVTSSNSPVASTRTGSRESLPMELLATSPPTTSRCWWSCLEASLGYWLCGLVCSNVFVCGIVFLFVVLFVGLFVVLFVYLLGFFLFVFTSVCVW